MSYEFQTEEHRIFIQQGDKVIAEILFPFVQGRTDTVVFNGTRVDPSLRGQGIAGQLMERALDVLDENQWKATATCSYVVDWFERNPEMAEKYKA